MDIYLVRHGETNGNLARRHQSDNTPLTFKGEKQALVLAEEVVALGATHVLTSTVLRALDTARIIGERADLVPETSALFAELHRPRHLWGYSHYSPRSLWFYVRWYFNLVDDGETYPALRQRIEQAKLQLRLYPREAKVVVVSHAVFITMFVVHLCRAKRIGLCRAAVALIRILTIKNGKMIRLHLDQNAPEGKCAWSLER